SVQDLALEYLEDEHCFLDMSSSMKFLGLRRTRELCELYGSDRILFGSDFPMWNPVSELERFRSIGFSESDMERMCWRNAERWLGIDIG
ncbi:MAG TPA: amidohydrolase family protein, partial [Atopobiaceae bacterium]|nr:amidohydrolase family protein [Atopobiaceae bacterium]